jgi:hypothetical protein
MRVAINHLVVLGCIVIKTQYPTTVARGEQVSVMPLTTNITIGRALRVNLKKIALHASAQILWNPALVLNVRGTIVAKVALAIAAIAVLGAKNVIGRRVSLKNRIGNKSNKFCRMRQEKF